MTRVLLVIALAALFAVTYAGITPFNLDVRLLALLSLRWPFSTLCSPSTSLNSILERDSSEFRDRNAVYWEKSIVVFVSFS